jgi:hypothetical protein
MHFCTWGYFIFITYPPKRTHEAETSLHQLFVRRTHKTGQVDNTPILHLQKKSFEKSPTVPTVVTTFAFC